MPSPFATPDDLTGSLLVVCLPLAPDLLRDDLPTLATPDDDLQPFLPARTTAYDGDEHRFWTWPHSRLVGYRREVASSSADEPMLGFGRSVMTVNEQVEGDQPVFRPASCCASLWQLPGQGLVLVLEQLRPLISADEVDELAALLREGNEPTYSLRKPDEVSARLRAGKIQKLIRAIAGPLLAEAYEPITLSSLFSTLPEALQSHTKVNEPLSQLLVHRPYVTRGDRHIEGLFIALAAGAGRTVTELVERMLDEDDFDQVDQMQQDGNFWNWSSREFTTDPAQKGATIAVREDGRAAFIDLEAMSVYHDYLGWGGDTTVLEALPLAADRAAEASDFWTAADTVRVLSAGEPDLLTERIDAVRKVRARVEQRAAVRDMRHSSERFTTWTNGGQLWSILDKVSTETETRDDAKPLDERTSRAIQVADSMLGDLESARQRHKDMFYQRVTTAMAAVGGLIGAVVLFTGLAAIPQSNGAAIQPLLRDGYIATAVSVTLTAVAYCLLLMSDRRWPTDKRSRSWSIAGATVVAIAAALAAAGSFHPQAFGPLCLFISWGLSLAGGAIVATAAPLVPARPS